jgi:hypothetical protein
MGFFVCVAHGDFQVGVKQKANYSQPPPAAKLRDVLDADANSAQPTMRVMRL